MVEVKISALVTDAKTKSPVILLQIPGTSRHLPIWIGPFEARSIEMQLQNQTFQRPLTHDLLKHVIDGLGGSVTRIVITSLQDNTFFAKIFISREHEIIAIDARPSDSIALAVRTQAPIFLSDEIVHAEPDVLLDMPLEEEASDSDGIEDLIRDVELGNRPDDMDDEGSDN